MGTFLPEEITNPESKLSYQSPQKKLFQALALVSILIEGVFPLAITENSRPHGGGRRRNDPKYVDPLKQKPSELTDVLDQSRLGIACCIYDAKSSIRLLLCHQRL